LAKFNQNDHMPAIDSRVPQFFGGPFGSRRPRLKPLKPIGESGPGFGPTVTSLFNQLSEKLVLLNIITM